MRAKNDRVRGQSGRKRTRRSKRETPEGAQQPRREGREADAQGSASKGGKCAEEDGTPESSVSMCRTADPATVRASLLSSEADCAGVALALWYWWERSASLVMCATMLGDLGGDKPKMLSGDSPGNQFKARAKASRDGAPHAMNL